MFVAFQMAGRKEEKKEGGEGGREGGGEGEARKEKALHLVRLDKILFVPKNKKLKHRETVPSSGLKG